jgi:Family of unknown function (DUF6037)
MNLPQLAYLHQDMKRQTLSKTKFDFQFRKLSFSVIYIAEQFPHELLFGCLSHNLFFVIQVKPGYQISTYLDKSYGELVRALDLRPDPSNPFSPKIFFQSFEGAIPAKTKPSNIPTLRDLAILSRDVEEADKIYFFGWLNHDGIKSKPSVKNLAKTQRICGNLAHNICLKYHISSKWTDDPSKEVQYYEPATK